MPLIEIRSMVAIKLGELAEELRERILSVILKKPLNVSRNDPLRENELCKDVNDSCDAIDAGRDEHRELTAEETKLGSV
uniref:Uncharacterized protein n=1 Tax=Heterorhabditis bacteriophora TaxID=37862 RepID=A0A1I7XFN0_HETBA